MTGPIELSVPGDKSVGHRALILASLSPGSASGAAPVRIAGLPDAADVRSTARALAEVGAEIDWPAGSDEALVTPPERWRADAEIDCGNSGTTARILCGAFAGLGLAVTLDGDESLRARPMDRVVYPLQAMGARIEYLDRGERLPVRLFPRATGHLRVLRYRSRVASAQVKSSLVLAALNAGVEFEMWEPGRSRDHTERMLRHLGVPIEFGPEDRGAHLHLPARARDEMVGCDLRVPGDPSSAAFLLAAGVLSGRPVSIDGLLLNETRTAYLEVLEAFGADIEIETEGEVGGEPVGRVTARPPEGGRLAGVEIGPEHMAGMIDEVPILAMLASRAEGETRVRGAAELRVKETDRLAALVDGLRDLGGGADGTEDGLVVAGNPGFVPRGRVRTHGDHRIAMAFGALGTVAGAEVEVDDPGSVGISFPGFWDVLARLESVAAG